MQFLNPNALFSFLVFLVWASNVSARVTPIKRGSRTSPPSGAVIVKQSGAAPGQFTSVQAAIDSLPNDSSSRSLFIHPGTYYEQVTISRPGPLTIYGSTEDTSRYINNSVTITHCESAGQAGNDVASSTLIVNKDDFKLFNVDLKNTFGRSSSSGQAVAVSASGNRLEFYGVGFYSYQDTVLAEAGKQFYGSCYIEGAVDFIFGQHAYAFFHKNTIASIGPGSITAHGPSNPADGIFVINDSKIVLASGAAPGATGQVYLGRPWSEYARVVITNSHIGAHVNSTGWDAWQMSQPNTDHVLFGEYGNTGPGASGARASFATKLSSASDYGIADVLGHNSAEWVVTYV